MMIKGTTKSGFNFSINEKYLDWELFEKFEEVDKNPLAIISIAKRMLGPKQYIKLKEHFRKPDGTVPIEDMNNEIEEIIKYNQSTKN